MNEYRLTNSLLKTVQNY